MKCMQCGSVVESSKGNYDYSALCGLANVTLVGVTVHRCATCGAHSASIPKMASLHAALAAMVINTVPKLSGAEVRFLRKFIGYSGADFAARVGVGAETVSRWENDKEPIGTVAERLVRLMVATEKRIESYETITPSEIADNRPARRYEVKQSAKGWDAHPA